LIKETQHSFVPPFNKILLKEIIKEVNQEDKEITELTNLRGREAVLSDVQTQSNYFLKYNKINRNKRCVLAYLNNRIDKIQNLVWDISLPFTNQIQQNLDDKEKKYTEEYNNLLKKYSKKYTFI